VPSRGFDGWLAPGAPGPACCCVEANSSVFALRASARSHLVSGAILAVARVECLVSGGGWRREWDSNFIASFTFCNLQIPKGRRRRRCQRCRGALPAIARTLSRSESSMEPSCRNRRHRTLKSPGPPVWARPYTKTYELKMKEQYDAHFYVGTINQHPKEWIVVGLSIHRAQRARTPCR
jgi:hypothetical protein